MREEVDVEVERAMEGQCEERKEDETRKERLGVSVYETKLVPDGTAYYRGEGALSGRPEWHLAVY